MEVAAEKVAEHLSVMSIVCDEEVEAEEVAEHLSVPFFRLNTRLSIVCGTSPDIELEKEALTDPG